MRVFGCWCSEWVFFCFIYARVCVWLSKIWLIEIHRIPKFVGDLRWVMPVVYNGMKSFFCYCLKEEVINHIKAVGILCHQWFYRLIKWIYMPSSRKIEIANTSKQPHWNKRPTEKMKTARTMWPSHWHHNVSDCMRTRKAQLLIC